MIFENLSSYRRTIERIRGNWTAFLEKRSERLKQQERHDSAAEVTENAYYRRITEEIIDSLLGSIQDLIEEDDKKTIYFEALEKTRRTTVTDEKISLV